jgi:hypothetical protein
MTRHSPIIGSVRLRGAETMSTAVSEILGPGRLRNTHIDLEKKVEVLTRELDEALEQQRATSEVLRVISSSPGELELVFQTMLAHAIRICEANFGALFRFEDGAASAAAMGSVIAFHHVT